MSKQNNNKTYPKHIIYQTRDPLNNFPQNRMIVVNSEAEELKFYKHYSDQNWKIEVKEETIKSNTQKYYALVENSSIVGHDLVKFSQSPITLNSVKLFDKQYNIARSIDKTGKLSVYYSTNDLVVVVVELPTLEVATV